jgi:hypothetical protein
MRLPIGKAAMKVGKACGVAANEFAATDHHGHTPLPVDNVACRHSLELGPQRIVGIAD